MTPRPTVSAIVSCTSGNSPKQFIPQPQLDCSLRPLTASPALSTNKHCQNLAPLSFPSDFAISRAPVGFEALSLGVRLSTRPASVAHPRMQRPFMGVFLFQLIVSWNTPPKTVPWHPSRASAARIHPSRRRRLALLGVAPAQHRRGGAEAAQLQGLPLGRFGRARKGLGGAGRLFLFFFRRLFLFAVFPCFKGTTRKLGGWLGFKPDKNKEWWLSSWIPT